MARKKRVLLMTVGTGYGPDGQSKLAHGMFTSIENIHPDFIVFFASETSISTIDLIKELVIEEFGEFLEGEDYSVVNLNQIDDFTECFLQFEESILEFNNDKVFIDYTSGTKTMSAALAAAGIAYKKELKSISGDRNQGVITSGTESIKSHNLYKIQDKIILKKIKEFFNSYRYISAIELLDDIINPNIDKDVLLKLFKAYSLWDNVKFEEAYDILFEIDLSSPELSDFNEDLKFNVLALGNMTRSFSANLKNLYILASLINNAKRRAEEFKYDDAIARLYRSLELIGQMSLEKYNLNSSDIDIQILKDKNVSNDFINGLEKIRGNDNKIKIGLIKDFYLLNELDNKLGKYFKENEKHINNLSKTRNNSILAHGLESQSKETYLEFEKVVIDLAMKLDKDMNKFLKETEFVKFNI